MKRLLLVWVGLVVMAAGAQAQGHVFFRVTLSAKAPGPVSGRVLVFLKQGTGDKEVDAEEFRPGATWVTSKEVHDLAPGASVEVDGTDVGISGELCPDAGWRVGGAGSARPRAYL